MLVLFDENGLTEPERWSNEPVVRSVGGQCAISKLWWTLTKEIDNIYEGSAVRFSSNSGIRCGAERARSNTAL